MKSTNQFEQIFDRIKEALGVRTDTKVANALGIKPSSIAGARKRKKIPPGWIETMAFDYQISSDWLWFGFGEKMLGDATFESIISDNLQHSDLGSLFKEYKELQVDNRELNKECHRLLRENGDLRVQVAEIKARAAPDEQTDMPDQKSA